MVVCNRAAVVGRCLNSAKDVIDHWVICDSGSTDGTQDIIREALREIPGALHEIPRMDVAPALTEALRLSKGKAEYHLLLDPNLEVRGGAAFREKLGADSYLVKEEGQFECWVERLISDRHEWRYAGLTRQFIRSMTATKREKLLELSVKRQTPTAASKDDIQSEIELLKESIRRGSNVARATFYLAQAFRDLGNLPQAIELYEKRAAMGGWDEEVWYSLYQVASLQQRLGVAWLLVLNQYLRAYQFRPSRIEPLFHIAKYYRETEQYHLGYLFSRTAIEAAYPDDLLFIERGTYESDLAREYVTCCRHLGMEPEREGPECSQAGIPSGFRIPLGASGDARNGLAFGDPAACQTLRS